jgi:NAD-dependent SIR2 family protein deacetylase
MKEKAIQCVKCHVSLEKGTVTFDYMGSNFPVELLVCPKCGSAFVPEDLAVGKMQQVEKTLEDK